MLATLNNMLIARDGFIFTSIAFPPSLFLILVIGFLWIGLEISEDMDLGFLYRWKTFHWVLTKIHKKGQKLILILQMWKLSGKGVKYLLRATQVGNDWINAWILIFWLWLSTLSYYTAHLPLKVLQGSYCIFVCNLILMACNLRVHF